MARKYNRRGFTLIEMLVVIAIVAMLVSIVVPAISKSTTKAKAASDAANLRTVLGMLNVHVVNGGQTVDEIIDNALNPTSKTDPDAVLRVVYDDPGFIDVYYVNGDTYYGLDYLNEVANDGASSLSTAAPTVPAGSVWYEAGVGEITD